MEYLEEWKAVKNFEGLYEVSNLGNVRSLIGHNNYHRIKLLKPSLVGYGKRLKYYQVYLYDRNKNRKSYKVHKLVAEAFIPNPDNLPCINHKDEITTNNTVDNLEWCTKQYNNTYGSAITKAVEKRTKTVYFYENDILRYKFSSVKDAGNFFNVSPQNIARVARGIRSKFHNFKVTYKPI